MNVYVCVYTLIFSVFFPCVFKSQLNMLGMEQPLTFS